MNPNEILENVEQLLRDLKDISEEDLAHYRDLDRGTLAYVVKRLEACGVSIEEPEDA